MQSLFDLFKLYEHQNKSFSMVLLLEKEKKKGSR